MRSLSNCFSLSYRSDGADGVAIALGGLEHDKALRNLDVKAFSRAPREAMATTLEYIECAPLSCLRS